MSWTRSEQNATTLNNHQTERTTAHNKNGKGRQAGKTPNREARGTREGATTTQKNADDQTDGKHAARRSGAAKSTKPGGRAQRAREQAEGGAKRGETSKPEAKHRNWRRRQRQNTPRRKQPRRAIPQQQQEKAALPSQAKCTRTCNATKAALYHRTITQKPMRRKGTTRGLGQANTGASEEKSAARRGKGLWEKTQSQSEKKKHAQQRVGIRKRMDTSSLNLAKIEMEAGQSKSVRTRVKAAQTPSYGRSTRGGNFATESPPIWQKGHETHKNRPERVGAPAAKEKRTKRKPTPSARREKTAIKCDRTRNRGRADPK